MDHGLARDRARMRESSGSATDAQWERRELLAWLGVGAVACAAGATGTFDEGTGGLDDDTCNTIPPETAGPYPGDGSNGPNVLALDGVVRRDLRSSFGGLSGTAEGVPLEIRLTLVSVSGGCAAAEGLAVYLWHCDRDGDYSLYTREDQNWLRGVQVSDANGIVSFTTIFPGCYSGRWPHVHFEVFASLEAALSGADPIATSQLALPEGACALVYESDGYEASAPNLDSTSLDSDNVFGDGADTQLPALSGSVEAGFVADLEVGV